MNNNFLGSFTVAVTPFTEDLANIDFSAWHKFLDWQIFREWGYSNSSEWP
jgi:dihydrodipicolinate synthase/N-acetylneuraminate lyase